MGLFRKNKKNNDFNILSGNGLIDYVRTNLKNPSDENVLKAVQEIAKPDDNQEHLTSEGSLPWGWHYLNRDFTDKIQNEHRYFFDNWYNSRNKSPLEQLGQLKSFVIHMHEAKELCYSKGECFAYWYDGVIASADYIKGMESDLQELEQNIETLQSQYQKREEGLKDIDKKIINKIKENEGILQTDFVKMFDESVQRDVKEKLYYMDKCGKIQRTKAGRSYLLHIKKGQE